MNVIDSQIYSNPNQLFPPPSFPAQPLGENFTPPAAIFTPRTTLYLAWAVRAALLMLYFPVQMLAAIVQTVHRLDLWASAVVTQTACTEPTQRVQ
jgi:hypothetical protein